MIKVLKQTPITVEGKDCYLQLLHDNSIWVEDACEYCCFRDWNDWAGTGDFCSQVHGCDIFSPTYFKITDL